jgi:hypothetical protein
MEIQKGFEKTEIRYLIVRRDWAYYESRADLEKQMNKLTEVLEKDFDVFERVCRRRL